jgi:hypothetical protein
MIWLRTGGGEICLQILVEIQQERDHLEDLSIDGRILKGIVYCASKWI